PVLVSDPPEKRHPLSVRRPHRTAAAILVASEANRFLGAQVHHPQLPVRTPRFIAHHDRVRQMAPIGRKRHASDRTQLRKIAAGQLLRTSKWAREKTQRRKEDES